MCLVNCWQLVIFAAGPWVGALMDSMPRVVAFKALCVVQVGGVVLCVLFKHVTSASISFRYYLRRNLDFTG